MENLQSTKKEKWMEQFVTKDELYKVIDELRKTIDIGFHNLEIKVIELSNTLENIKKDSRIDNDERYVQENECLTNCLENIDNQRVISKIENIISNYLTSQTGKRTLKSIMSEFAADTRDGITKWIALFKTIASIAGVGIAIWIASNIHTINSVLAQ